MALTCVAVLGLPTCAASETAPAAASDASAPVRIVSLVPAITETLFAIGLGPRVIGVSTYCDYPAEAAELPQVGTFSEPVAEVIVNLHPDLVLTSPSPGNETAVKAIERSGVKVAVVQSEGTLREARAAMLDVANAAGASEEGQRLVAELDRRFAVVKAAAQSLDHPKAAIAVGREPLVLAGPGSYLGELLTLAGGVNVADAIGGRWPRVGMEFLVAAAPDVLVDLSVSMGETPSSEDLQAAWSTLPSLPAVANGRVVGDRASLMLRPGPRLAEAAEALFAALHPSARLATTAPATAALPTSGLAVAQRADAALAAAAAATETR